LSDFAEYVEKQQVARRTRTREASAAPGNSGYSSLSAGTRQEDHAELDILDTLNLSDSSAHIKLKDLLLDNSPDGESTLEQLSNVVQSRILEGHGETLFDLGQEDNGESMGFTKEQWLAALDRVQRASALIKANCRVLMTRNVGGEEEVGPANEKDKSATGKIMIRQKPENVEEVIETRIAVVGNGE
jgi:GTPase